MELPNIKNSRCYPTICHFVFVSVSYVFLLTSKFLIEPCKSTLLFVSVSYLSMCRLLVLLSITPRK
nr:MAG TPA: hypothetical protein [Bacteriophage sp.]